MNWQERVQRLVDRVSSEGQQAFHAVNRRLGGLPLLLQRTLTCYSAHDGPFVAAAMGYYFFFALFPLALALIAIGTLFLATEQAQTAVIDFLVQIVPVSSDTIANSVNLALEQRGTITVLAALGLVYSASGLFGLLMSVMDRAWGRRCVRSPVARVALSVSLVAALALVFFLSSFATTFFEAILRPASDLLSLDAAQTATAYTVLSLLISFLLSIGAFLLLYWKLPSVKVKFADAWPAAAVAGIIWQIVRLLFAWYLARFTRYTLVYGSLAAVIGLLTWLYLTGYIILLGAELSAQIAERRGRGPGGCVRCEDGT